ncbi:hypothetical protein BDW22DRAFT_1482898 [Trametopsis cervina]|nr:hypothetical protein BDW22DRAFT_1482898 [Trametopsis cervina]
MMSPTVGGVDPAYVVYAGQQVPTTSPQSTQPPAHAARMQSGMGNAVGGQGRMMPPPTMPMSTQGPSMPTNGTMTPGPAAPTMMMGASGSGGGYVHSMGRPGGGGLGQMQMANQEVGGTAQPQLGATVERRETEGESEDSSSGRGPSEEVHRPPGSQRFAGHLEQLAGYVIRSPEMIERGKQRKTRKNSMDQ